MIQQPGWPAPLQPEIEGLETTGIAEIFALAFEREVLIPLLVGEPFVQQMLSSCRTGRELVYQLRSALSRVKIMRPQGGFYSFSGSKGWRTASAMPRNC